MFLRTLLSQYHTTHPTLPNYSFVHVMNVLGFMSWLLTSFHFILLLHSHTDQYLTLNVILEEVGITVNGTL